MAVRRTITTHQRRLAMFLFLHTSSIHTNVQCFPLFERCTRRFGGGGVPRRRHSSFLSAGPELEDDGNTVPRHKTTMAHVYQSQEVANAFLDIRKSIPMEQEQMDIILRLIRAFQPIKAAAAAAAAPSTTAANSTKDNCLQWMDLGCGDGAIGCSFLEAFPTSRGILIDHSKPMLQAAQDRLENNKNKANVSFLQCDFSTRDWIQQQQQQQDNNTSHDDKVILSSQTKVKKEEENEDNTSRSSSSSSSSSKLLLEENSFDVIVSAFAIHHVSHTRKQELYNEIFHLLRPGGIFLNMEHVSVASPQLEKIFESAFCDSMYNYYKGTKTRQEVIDAVQYDLMIDQEENILTSTEVQCDWLRQIGFEHVDCYFKFFLLSLFGGVKKKNNPNE